MPPTWWRGCASESPDTAPAPEPLSLDAVLRQALDLHSAELSRLGVSWQIAGQAPPVRADRIALDQVLHNLLGNALQALAAVPAGQRRRHMQLEALAGQARLTLRDSGPGLPTEVRAHLFEPFVSVRPSGAQPSAGRGLGLGLSLSASLAEAMGGRLQSPLTGPDGDWPGACFILTLPLAESAP